jgi:hypothetical protein
MKIEYGIVSGAEGTAEGGGSMPSRQRYFAGSFFGFSGYIDFQARDFQARFDGHAGQDSGMGVLISLCRAREEERREGGF